MVKLTEIFDFILMLGDDTIGYWDKEASVIISSDTSYLGKVEEGKIDDEEIMDIFDNPERYVKLPEKYEIDYYRLMKEFCFSVTDEDLRGKLLKAISSRGAFRRFKDMAYDYGIIKDYYDFFDKSIYELSKKWCIDNNIDYIE